MNLRLRLVLIFFVVTSVMKGQLYHDSLDFFQPDHDFNKARFYSALGFSSITYTGFSIGLYQAWYRNYEQTGFHFFNDWGEWNNMDKAGHVYTAYFQGVLCYKGGKWTGLSDDKAILTGLICGGLFQTTIEVMDGFTEKWGFSIFDFGANAVGLGTFALQQKYWGQQKIILKESSTGSIHPLFPVTSLSGTSTTTLKKRGEDLFGSSLPERYLKDYNNQTYWLSVNIHSLLPEGNIFPAWLNLAFGYGSENLYGGFDNSWESDEQVYVLDPGLYPRYRQYYLSLDVDLTRIGTSNHFLKSLLSVFNIIKVPAPALEVTSSGEVIFHFLKF